MSDVAVLGSLWLLLALGQAGAPAAEHDATARFESAWNLAGEGALEPALAAIEDALEHPDRLGPRIAAALELRADLKRRVGDLEGALVDVQLARELHPAHAAELDRLYPGLAGFLAAELPTLEAELALECGLPDLARPALEEAWTRLGAAGAEGDPLAFSNWVRSSLNLELAVDDVAGALAAFERALDHPLCARVPASDRAAWAVRVGVALCLAQPLGEQAVFPPGAFFTALLDEGRLPAGDDLPWSGHDELAGALQPSAEERASACLWLITALLDAGLVGEAQARLEDFPGDRSSPEFLVRRARLERGRGAGASVRQALARELRDAIDRLAEAGVRVPLRPSGHGWLLFGERRELLSEWIALRAPELQPGRAHELLEVVLGLHSLGTLARTRALPRADVALLAELLGEGGLGLSFVAGRTASFVLASDRAAVTLHELAPDPLLQAARSELAGALHERLTCDAGTRDRAETRLESAIEKASRAFLPPDLELRIAGCSRLVVTAGDELGSLPLGLLRGASGSWLGASHAIEHWPSVPLAAELALRESRSPSRTGTLAAGFLDPDPSGVDARADRRSLDEPGLLRLLGLSEGSSLRVLAGGAATRAALSEALVRGPALACLLFHGRPDAQRPGWASELVCAPGGAQNGLGVGHLEGQHGLPGVVVLLACGALRAPLRRGDDGGLSLASAFLSGGSACVLAAPTPLPAEATLAFWRELAAQLARRPEGGPAEALRRVRQACLERGAAWDELAAAFAFRVHGWGRAELPAELSIASGVEAVDGAGDGAHPRKTGSSARVGRGLALSLVAAGLALAWFARTRRRKTRQPGT